METYKVKTTFQEPMLGTVPKDKEVYAAYIASLGEQTEDELETVKEIEEKGWTGFHMVDDKPIIYNYMVKGFFKEACGALRRVSSTKSSKLGAYKKVIDKLIFIKPRRLEINLNGGEMGILERPLRASTPKGERVTVTRSDTVPIGASVEFEVLVFGVVTKPQLIEWFDYGEFSGFGQWRNAEYGRFLYELCKVK